MINAELHAANAILSALVEMGCFALSIPAAYGGTAPASGHDKLALCVTREAMQIHAGMGYSEETAVRRYFVDARVLSIFEGAGETLALKVVARELILQGG